jgi:hypothetical protein
MNQIVDCPITVDDVDIAQAIWGQNVTALKGKTIRKTPLPVVSDLMHVSKEFLTLHQKVFMAIDIFYVNDFLFFLSTTRKVCFAASSHIPSRSHVSIMATINEHVDEYTRRGFQIKTVAGDHEFESLRRQIEALPGKPRLNVSAANEHQPDVERKIRVLKERVRALRASLPYTKLPPVMLVHMILHVTKMLNNFPTKSGFAIGYSPRMLMTGEPLNYKKHLALGFGDYCQVHENDEPRNSQAPRTQGAICIGTTSSLQGTYRFLNLRTGKKITRFGWTLLPTPDSVIDRVNTLGEGQPSLLVFKDCKGHLIGDSDEVFEPPGVDELAGVGDDDEDADEVTNNTMATDEIDVDEMIEEVVANDDEDNEGVQDAYSTTIDVDVVQDGLEQPELQPAPDAETPGVHNGIPGVPPGVRRSTRVKVQTMEPYIPSMTGSKYATSAAQMEGPEVLHPDSHLFFQMSEEKPSVIAAIMTQLSLKAGMKE